MKGFYGRLLSVDLGRRSFEIEPIADELLESHLGGKGLATRLLVDRNPAGIDPFHPDNHLIFATGPFCQGRLWGGARYGVFTKGPLTGRYLESYSGGRAPEAMDAAGFDAVLIRGRAENPTALTIHPEGALFHDAADLWGRETYDTEDEARRRFGLDREGYGKPGAVVIGPAGEKGVRFAVIENDYWRSAGRGGAGAVMGSKNLKAVVFQGDRRREPFDPDGVAEYSKNFLKRFKDNPGVQAYKNRGTTMMVAIMNMAQAFPTRYWTEGTWADWQKISGDTYHQDHDITPHACLKCFMACGRMARIKGGRHDGLKIEGPEYETLYAFGGLCLIDDLGEIAHLNDLCDRLGIDTITAGNLCAFTIEAVRRGRVSYPIDYGDPEGAARLVQDIAGRKGIGDLLAEGIVRTAAEWGLDDLAVHVKGMEPAGYDPRTLKGMGLAYAVSDRGACHLRTTFYKPELAGMIDRNAVKDKAAMLIDFEDRLTLFDGLILCRFYRDLYSWDELAESVHRMTGLAKDPEVLRAVARRTADLCRTFNLREGLRPEEDRLPGRLLREPLPTGQALTEAEMDYLVRDYYQLRGWADR